MSGVGWWLSLVDALASEYGWPLPQILALPLAQALCLRAAMAERYEVDRHEPTFAERDLIASGFLTT